MSRYNIQLYKLLAVIISGTISGIAGASYGKTWDEAFAKYVTEVVSETTEFCEVVYTKS